MPTFEALAPHIGARVHAVDLSRTLDAPSLPSIRRARDRHAFLVFRAQPIDDAVQAECAARFGRLKKTRLGTVGQGQELVAA